ncbi:hypothetical protein DFH08DRAFT_818620 [Mycena albidolilacea]|uniref:Uncharacterized protein n=1 Tax=Mycena albidolilacea TaxID=1033008 RepID=A0AAD6ZGN3_9AGAR|nr:hypothetical protein DFH08DRAFT_818620 [Mycena albidolilacea]
MPLGDQNAENPVSEMPNSPNSNSYGRRLSSGQRDFAAAVLLPHAAAAAAALQRQSAVAVLATHVDKGVARGSAQRGGQSNRLNQKSGVFGNESSKLSTSNIPQTMSDVSKLSHQSEKHMVAQSSYIWT